MKSIQEVFAYMNKHGYGVWQGVYGDKLGFFVRGFFLNENQLRWLSFHEECSLGGEVDGLEITLMAQDCLKIAEHPALNSLEADEGRDLYKRFQEWENPWVDVPIDQLRILVKRLGAYLTRNFMYLWPESMKVHRPLVFS